MKNCRGTDKILSVYWFAILFIVAGAIVYMAVLFYGEPYDLRKIETNLLSNQISNCISQGGVLKDNVFDEERKLKEDFDLVKECHLNFNVESYSNWKEQEQYYVKVSFYNFRSNSFLFDFPAVGNINLKDTCNDKGDNSPFCVEKSFYVIKGDNQYLIKILSIVRKTEKNVR